MFIIIPVSVSAILFDLFTSYLVTIAVFLFLSGLNYTSMLAEPVPVHLRQSRVTVYYEVVIPPAILIVVLHRRRIPFGMRPTGSPDKGAEAPVTSIRTAETSLFQSAQYTPPPL